MKTVLPTLLHLVGMIGAAIAFNGQVILDPCPNGESCTILELRDYDTGSTYSCGNLPLVNCKYDGACRQFCKETSPGGYQFIVNAWSTGDGCINLNFDGALDSGHGWCCGGTPCDLTA